MYMKTAYESMNDPTQKRYYELQYCEKAAGQKAGWYLCNVDDPEDRFASFYLPPGEPREIARLRARDHAKFFNMRVVKIPSESPDD